MKTLIVMPAHNEVQTIGAVLARLRAVVPDADILVINDASTDETAKVAEQAGATVLNLPINLGYGGAVQTGFKYASRKGYEAVVLMDADGQHDPECVPDLLTALQEADFVLGSRFLGDCRYKVPLSRRIGMWLFGTLVRLVTQLPITDPTSGFQALRREVVVFLADEHYPVDFPDADVLILLHHRIHFESVTKGTKVRAALRGTIEIKRFYWCDEMDFRAKVRLWGERLLLLLPPRFVVWLFLKTQIVPPHKFGPAKSGVTGYELRINAGDDSGWRRHKG